MVQYECFWLVAVMIGLCFMYAFRNPGKWRFRHLQLRGIQSCPWWKHPAGRRRNNTKGCAWKGGQVWKCCTWIYALFISQILPLLTSWEDGRCSLPECQEKVESMHIDEVVSATDNNQYFRIVMCQVLCYVYLYALSLLSITTLMRWAIILALFFKWRYWSLNHSTSEFQSYTLNLGQLDPKAGPILFCISYMIILCWNVF